MSKSTRLPPNSGGDVDRNTLLGPKEEHTISKRELRGIGYSSVETAAQLVDVDGFVAEAGRVVGSTPPVSRGSPRC